MKKLVALVLSLLIMSLGGTVAFSEEASSNDTVYTKDNAVTFCDFENVTGGERIISVDGVEVARFGIVDTGDEAYGKAFKIPAYGYADAKKNNLVGSYTFDGTTMTLFNEPLEENTYYIMEYDFKATATDKSNTSQNFFSFAPQLADFQSTSTDYKDYTTQETGKWIHHRIAFYSGNKTTIDIKINTEASYYESYIDNYRITKAVEVESAAPVSGDVAIRKGTTDKYCTYYNHDVSIELKRGAGEILTYSMGAEGGTLASDTLTIKSSSKITVTSQVSKSLFREELSYPTTKNLDTVYVKAGDSVSDLLSASNLDRSRAKYYDKDGDYKAFSPLEINGTWKVYPDSNETISPKIAYSGDMDSNTTLNVTDLVSMVDIALQNGSDIAADLNNNGKCTVLDVIELRKIILNYDSLFEKEDGVFKILSMGNSFGQDSVMRLHEVAEACGYSNFVFGYLLIHGSTIGDHYDRITGKSNDIYSYNEYNSATGKWTSNSTEATIHYCIEAQNWDVIVFQAESGESGKPEEYTPFIYELVDIVKSEATNKNIEFYWHSTWAYPEIYYDTNYNVKDNTTTAYLNPYQNSQSYMYDCIVDATQNVAMKSGLYTGLFFTGTAIQNMRGTIVGDNMNRDQHHLESNYGRLTSSLTWIKTLYPEADLSKILTDSTCLATLEAGVTELAKRGVTITAQELGKYCIAAAEAAVKNPYAVTQISIE